MSQFLLLLFGILGCIHLGGCTDDEIVPYDDTNQSNAKGYLLKPQMSINFEYKQQRIMQTVVPEDYMVTIKRLADQALVEGTPTLFKNLPDTLLLDTGNYQICIHSNNALPAAFENPYFEGCKYFTVTRDQITTILVEATPADMKVTVDVSQRTYDDFIEFETLVVGNDSLLFEKGEDQDGYYEVAPLYFQTTLQFYDSDEILQTQVLTANLPNTQAGWWYKALVNAIVEDGNAVISISINDAREDTTIIIGEDPNANWVGGEDWVDPRDGVAYKTKVFGDRIWMVTNFQGQQGNATFHPDDINQINGKLYTLPEAINATPFGWRLATDEDWIALETHNGMPIGHANQFGNRGSIGLVLQIGGSSGFHASLGGLFSNNTFSGWEVNGIYWTSSTRDTNDQQIFRAFSDNDSRIVRSGTSAPTSERLSVRYVRDL